MRQRSLRASRPAPDSDKASCTVAAFNKYDNVLAFNIGNEIVTGDGNSNTAPYIKAAARDVKAYLKSINSTALVGYSATYVLSSLSSSSSRRADLILNRLGSDGDNNSRVPLAEFLSCGSDASSIDIYGLNNYRALRRRPGLRFSG